MYLLSLCSILFIFFFFIAEVFCVNGSDSTCEMEYIYVHYSKSTKQIFFMAF